MAFRLVSTDIPTIIIGRSNSLIRGSIRLVGWEKKAARIRLMEIICLQSVVDGDGTSLRLRAAQRPRAERPGQDSFRVSRRAGRVRSSELLGGRERTVLGSPIRWQDSAPEMTRLDKGPLQDRTQSVSLRPTNSPKHDISLRVRYDKTPFSNGKPKPSITTDLVAGTTW